jgi:hypothetical protein
MHRLFKGMLLSLLLLGAGTGAAWAQVVATVTHLSGVLSATHADGSAAVLAVRSAVMQGDLLATAADSFARLRFADESEVVLRPGTRLRIDRFNYDAARPEADSLALAMFKGGMRAVSGLIGARNKAAVSYTTPTATIGIRGTHFGALLCAGDCDGLLTSRGVTPADGLHVDVARGAIELRNDAGTMVVNTGEFGYVRDRNTAPALELVDDGVQVTMPAQISLNVPPIAVAQDIAIAQGVVVDDGLSCRVR